MISIVPQWVLVRLMHRANSDPSFHRQAFYDLKARLLRKYGTIVSEEYQEITKECWGDKWHDDGYWTGCGPNCRRCSGTGIYDRRWWRLYKWKWAGFTFHTPAGPGPLCTKPDRIHINGRIEHQDYGLSSRECELWLYLVTLQFKTFWYVLSSSSYCHPKWYPLCRLQKVATKFRSTFRRMNCGRCGKRFWTWGTGWCVCKQCRKPKPLEMDHYEELPF